MPNPKVSVVIPTIGSAENVLKDLDKQTFRDFEVILAKEKGIVHAMNKALEKAKGEILVRIDDDVRLPQQWLDELIRPFKSLYNESIGGVTGPTFVPKELRQNRDSIRFAEDPKGILRWLYDNGDFNPAGIRQCGCVSYDSNFEERFILNKARANWRYADHLEGTNWAVRTELIRAVGGFDESFDGVCEWYDDDVVFKIKKHGYSMVYNPKAYLYHMLEKGGHYNERFEGLGRIKNFIRFHSRHSKFHYKMVIYLIIWMGYFAWKKFQ